MYSAGSRYNAFEAFRADLHLIHHARPTHAAMESHNEHTRRSFASPCCVRSMRMQRNEVSTASALVSRTADNLPTPALPTQRPLAPFNVTGTPSMAQAGHITSHKKTLATKTLDAFVASLFKWGCYQSAG
jgi:hypothetical protein